MIRWLPVVLVLLAGVPASASAYSVTVRVHGAGGVIETTNRQLTYCNGGVPADGKSNASVTDCVGGTPSGVYNYGDIVAIEPNQATSTVAYARGWRFQKWVDHSGAGLVNCDPQNATGDLFTAECRFQIFENLAVDLYFQDQFAPQDTAILTGTPAAGATTSSTDASFTYGASSDPDASYQCRLDRPGQPTAGYSACPSSGISYSNLTTDGGYTFVVRATDPSGNTNGSLATRSWTHDGTAPVPTISGGPAEGSFTTQTSASFTLAGGSGATITGCTLDGAPRACTAGSNNTVGSLVDGPHTFTVTARDAANNVGSTSRSWVVDTTAPVVAIDGGPAEGSRTAATTATFTPKAMDVYVQTTSCQLDGTAVPCSADAPYTAGSLSDGSHTFAVSAVDKANNSSTAMRTWIVDTTPPTVSITSGPDEGSTTMARDAGLTFLAGEDSTFACSLDAAAFTACTSPFAVSGLADGPHVFRVRGTDAVGNVGAPVSRAWTVTSAPSPSPSASPMPSPTPTVTASPAGTPPVAASISYRFKRVGTKTRIRKLLVSGLDAAARVTARCTGRKCPLRRVSAPSRSGRVDLRKLIGGRRFPAGVRLTILVKQASHVTRVAVVAFRKRGSPSVSSLDCLPPGTKQPAAC